MITQKGCFTASLLFADIKGLSGLTNDEQLAVFFEEFQPEVSDIINDYHPLAFCSMGDAIFCAFGDSLQTAHCALDLRDFFRNYAWQKSKLPRLHIHISLHTGRAYSGSVSAIPGDGLLCAQLNLAVRLEPVLRSGEVWTSDPFMERLQSVVHGGVGVDNMGIRHLAQKWGGREIYRLKRENEPPLEDDALYEKSDVKRIDPIGILLTLYERGDDEQQINAIRMLGKKDDPRALEKLCAIARDSGLSLLHRLSAISSLGEMKNSGAIVTLEKILATEEREDPRLQVASINALVSIGDAQGGAVISTLLHDFAEFQIAVVRKAMHSLLVLKNQPALDTVRELVLQNALQGQLLKTALQVLTTVGDQKATSAALKLLDPETVQDVRHWALTYMAYTNPHAVNTELHEIARDTNESLDIRTTALAGLAMIDSNETKMVLADIAEAAESLSSYAAQFLIDGKERADRLAEELREDIRNESL